MPLLTSRKRVKAWFIHPQYTLCHIFFIYLGFYIMIQVTLCRTKWPFLLLNQRESFGCIAKGFLRSLLQIYILVLSNSLKITGLFYSSPFCPYLYSLNWYECTVLKNLNWVIFHRNSSSEPFFFLSSMFYDGHKRIGKCSPSWDGRLLQSNLSFITYILEIVAKSKVYTIFIWKVWLLLKML